MRRSLKELLGYSVEALDGTKGEVHDFLFDEEQWVINYLHADLGSLFRDKQVIIPRMFWKNPKWLQEQFEVGVGKKDIEACPLIDEKLPVSKQYEQRLVKHYEAQAHLHPYNVAPALATAAVAPPKAIYTTSNDGHLKSPNLRSLREVLGYAIKTTDEEIGQLHDLIVDDRDWRIAYCVIDTQKYIPWSKKVLVEVAALEKISYQQQQIYLNMSSKALLSSYEYDPAEAVNEVYQKRKFDYLGRPIM